MTRSILRAAAIIAVLAIGAAACSSDDSDRADGSSPTSGVGDATTSTTGDASTGGDDERAAYVREVVETLVDDELQGRAAQTPGSAAAQQYLIGELSEFAEPMFPDADGNDGYLQTYDEGANILAVVPGDELPDEYVMIGAHYDGKGNVCDAANCDPAEADDDIYNGANDNAAGVAATLDIARAIAADGPPRRSIVVALWDGEEQGLVGSRNYSENPAIPPGQTVAYVNFDIHGANLLPSLRNATILIGAETGGPELVQAATRATETSTLDTAMLSLLFGEGRSDHTNLLAIGVPVVFLTDANNGCYHNPKDDIDAVDFSKLDQQIVTAEALMRELAESDGAPALDPTAPPSTYDDAVQLLDVIETAEPDFGLFGTDGEAGLAQYLVDLQAIVDAGAEGFDEAAVGTLLAGAAAFVSGVRDLPCDPYLD